MPPPGPPTHLRPPPPPTSLPASPGPRTPPHSPLWANFVRQNELHPSRPYYEIPDVREGSSGPPMAGLSLWATSHRPVPKRGPASLHPALHGTTCRPAQPRLTARHATRPGHLSSLLPSTSPLRADRATAPAPTRITAPLPGSPHPHGTGTPHSHASPIDALSLPCPPRHPQASMGLTTYLINVFQPFPAWGANRGSSIRDLTGTGAGQHEAGNGRDQVTT